MADHSAIEWTNATWNPTTGCDRVSPGCDNCYALTLAARLKAMGQPKYQNDGDPRTSGPGFGLTVHEDALTIPLRWRRPRRVFVNSMSDLFHDDVPDEFIARVFAVMAIARKHTFQVLTKRHGRMRSLVSGRLGALMFKAIDQLWADGVIRGADAYLGASHRARWPLPNVWLGVSVETQQWADIRVPALLDTPAAVRWLSCEPLLGPIDLHWCNGIDAIQKDWAGNENHGTGTPHPLIDWVVVGGESGPNTRSWLLTDWARSLRDQCVEASVPFFFKQVGGCTPKSGGRLLDGRTWDEYPASAS